MAVFIITMCWETDVEDSDSLSDRRNVLTPQSIVQIIKWVCFLCSWYNLMSEVCCWVSLYLVLFCFSVFEIRGSALCPQLPHRSTSTLHSVLRLISFKSFFVFIGKLLSGRFLAILYICSLYPLLLFLCFQCFSSNVLSLWWEKSHKSPSVQSKFLLHHVCVRERCIIYYKVWSLLQDEEHFKH